MSGLEVKTQIFAYLVLVDELTADGILSNGSDQHLFRQFCLFFIVEFEVEEGFLANVDIVASGNREPYAAS